jgi:hypothetical protein
MRVTTTVEIDEDEVLGEIGDELLVQELESRGYSCVKTGLDTRTAASLLDKLYVEAKKKTSPLHTVFEWDEKKAAHAYRIAQARSLIRSVKIEITTETTVIKTVAYLRDPDLPNEEQGYVSVASLRGDPERARAAIVQEFSRAAGALRRARELAVALDLVGEVDAIAEAVHVVRTKVEARVEQRQPS